MGGDGGGVGLGCNHIFHHSCITDLFVNWTKEQNPARSRCPICRAPIVSMHALDKDGVRVHEIAVPEMADAVADAARDGVELNHNSHRVHTGVSRALRTLQSELRGAVPAGRRRNR